MLYVFFPFVPVDVENKINVSGFRLILFLFTVLFIFIGS